MSPAIRGHVSRDALPIINQLLNEEPAVLLEGSRGSGKSTLVREVAATGSARIVDLDDEAVIAFVLQDPTTALAHPGLVVVDEFQRVPAVLSVVKRIVDRSGEPGRFLLAGSVSARLLPTGAETLTGRVHRMLLPPLSTAEIVGSGSRLLPSLVSDNDPAPIASSWRRPDYFEYLAAGGYPAALARPTPNSRRRWFASYLGSVAERDLPQVADIRHPGALPRLYRLIAQQTSTVIGRTALGEQLGLAPATARAYLDLLTHVYLVRELPGWTVGISAKAGHRPKIHVTDTGLAAAAIGADGHRLASGQQSGLFLESYVVTELMKQATLIDEPLTLAHFRDRSGVEVDIIIERPDGRVIAIEVKSATTTNQADARGLRFLSDRLGDRLQAGLLLHTGPLTARLSERIWTTPVSALWGGTPPANLPTSASDADPL
jgi:predicted AAA+ superfamily ATPase